MAEPIVVSVMRGFRESLLSRDAAEMEMMARRWLQVEDYLASEIESLARELEAEKAAGRSISQTKLYRMQRYQTLLGQLDTELEKYQDYVAERITQRQLEMAYLGIEHASQAIAVSATVSAVFDRLPISAVEHMVGLAGDGSPLKKLLKASYPDAVEGITKNLIKGTALGWHPTKTARAMRQGSEMGLQRSLVISRTETLRVYRASSDAQYVASGVVAAKKRLSAHQSRTCLACLLKDGELMPVDEPFFDHVSGRCTQVPVLVGEAEITWDSGRKWFLEQDEETQRQIMGKGRFEAWKDGAVKLDDFAVETEDATWGKSLGVRSLKEIIV